MNEDERRKLIVDYISNHQGCKAEGVVEGVKKHLSRVPVYRTLEDLIKDGTVKDQATNRRDHKLSVDFNNLLVSVPLELDEFKVHFYRLVEIVSQNYKKLNIDDGANFFELFSIFSELVNVYNYYGLFIWPKLIEDPKTLNKLYITVFESIREIQFKLVRKIGPLYLDSNKIIHDLERHFDINMWIRNRHKNNHASEIMLNQFKRNGIENEGKVVLESLWKISKDIHPIGTSLEDYIRNSPP
jgi:hypothetical protein